MSAGRLLAETDEFIDAAAARRRSTWSPNRPWPKQQEWIGLDVLESCYGGGAGGGKTDAMLASALRFFDHPRYTALILRRTFSDLNLPDAIMDRARQWLGPTRARWSERDKRWTAPGGAVLQFGYCDTERDLDRYKGPAFQFVGIDEVTEWPEQWYTFLFSRLRKPAGSAIPLRMRSATNPDGLGQEWVRQRFGIPRATRIEAPIWTGHERVFWPALADDNPSLDLPSYEAALEKMTGGRGGVKWKQLREGLWIPDNEGLVYAYDAGRNLDERLVVDTKRDAWTFILGIDYGYADDCAFVVVGWRQHDSTVYAVHASKLAEMTPSKAAEYARSLEQRFAFAAIVGDIGGLGKGYIEEARDRFGLPIEAAQKNNKRGYIDLMNGALRAGQVKVGPGCEALTHEWTVLPWDTGRQREAPGFANHLTDAALYAWRATWSYLEREPPAPPPNREQRLAAEEERLARELDEEEARDRGGRGWARRMARR